MWNKWGNTTNNIGWTRSPFRNPEVDDCIDSKHKNNEKKYLERGMFIADIFPIDSIEPDTNEHEGSPEHNEFPEELDNLGSTWRDEMSSGNQEIGVVGEE